MPRFVALPMRCAAEGDRFHAVFRWSEERCEYVLVKPVHARRSGTPPRPGPPEKTHAAGPAVASAAAGSRGSHGRCESPSEVADENATDGHASRGPAPAAEFDLSEFNFKGFACPVCGYGEKVPLTRGTPYFHCGRCRELVCGARLSEARGSLSYRCTNECGNSGTFSQSSDKKPMKVSGQVAELRETGTLMLEPPGQRKLCGKAAAGVEGATQTNRR